MSDLWKSNSYREIQEMKYENPDYWNMMDVSQGVDPIVKQLMQKLSCGSVFEYGAWRGRNAIPLAENGYEVHVQDIASKPLVDLASTAKSRGIEIQTTCGDALRHQLTRSYDAFVCLRVLHFMESPDAWNVLENMKSHTNDGGFHALVIFIDQTPHGSSGRLDIPFFPSVWEIRHFYSDWNILFEEISTSEPTATTRGKSMTRLTILLQKTSQP